MDDSQMSEVSQDLSIITICRGKKCREHCNRNYYRNSVGVLCGLSRGSGLDELGGRDG